MPVTQKERGERQCIKWSEAADSRKYLWLAVGIKLERGASANQRQTKRGGINKSIQVSQ